MTAISSSSLCRLSDDQETVYDDRFVAVKWQENIMLLGLAKKPVSKFNRHAKIKSKMMSADLTVWKALHLQEKKEVTAIQFVEDEMSEREVASRANKKMVGKKNRVGSKREQQLSTCIYVAQMLFFACLLPLHLCMSTFKNVGHAYA